MLPNERMLYSQCSFNVTTWLVPDVRKQSHCDAGILSEIFIRTNPINFRSLSLQFSLLTCCACPSPCHYPLPFVKARVGIFANITTWKVDLHTRYPLSVYLNSQAVQGFKVQDRCKRPDEWQVEKNEKRHEQHKKGSLVWWWLETRLLQAVLGGKSVG